MSACDFVMCYLSLNVTSAFHEYKVRGKIYVRFVVHSFFHKSIRTIFHTNIEA